MSHARAAVAGMLTAVILVIVLRADSTDGNPVSQHAVVAFLVLVGVIALLVGTDVLHAVRRRTYIERERRDEYDEVKEEDDDE